MTEQGPRLLPGRPLMRAGLWDTWTAAMKMIGRRTAASAASLRLIKYIRDYNPDASLSVWNMIRLATEIESIVIHMADDPAVPHEEAQKRFDSVDDPGNGVLGREYGGGVESIAVALCLAALTQGAVALEVGLAEGLTDIIGVFPVDPSIISFQRGENGIPYPCIATSGTPQPLNEEQFRYFPVDPDVNDPYGRSPMWPTLETIEFQTQLLRDLKAVAHNQGFPRIDVKVLKEVILENIREHQPHLLQPTEAQALEEQLGTYLEDLQTQYNELHPDDTFIHYNDVEVGMTGGAGSGSINLQHLIETVDSQVVSALKTLPILLGRNAGSTTTHATVQWQIFVATVKAFRKLLNRSLTWAINLTLRVWGYPAKATITFQELRTSDRVKDAMARKSEIESWKAMVNAGWATDDEASMDVLGHVAAGEKMIMPLLQFGQENESEDEPEDNDEDNEPQRVVGQRLAAAVAAQVGDGAFSGEAAEVALLPWYMKAWLRQTERELAIPGIIHSADAEERLLAIPDEEWDAAMELDLADEEAARAGYDTARMFVAANRDNGH